MATAWRASRVEDLCRIWVRVYTAGLPPDVQRDRREELESDIWEHAQANNLPGGVPSVRDWHLAARVIRGMLADISWRIDVGAKPGWSALALAFAAVYVALAASAWFQPPVSVNETIPLDSAAMSAPSSSFPQIDHIVVPHSWGRYVDDPNAPIFALALVAASSVLVLFAAWRSARSRRVGGMLFILAAILSSGVVWWSHLGPFEVVESVAYLALGSPGSAGASLLLTVGGALIAYQALSSLHASPRLGALLMVVAAPVLSWSILGGLAVAWGARRLSKSAGWRRRAVVLAGLLAFALSGAALLSGMDPRVALLGTLLTPLLVWGLMVFAVARAHGLMIAASSTPILKVE